MKEQDILAKCYQNLSQMLSQLDSISKTRQDLFRQLTEQNLTGSDYEDLCDTCESIVLDYKTVVSDIALLKNEIERLISQLHEEAVA